MARTDFKSFADFVAVLSPGDAEAIRRMRQAVLAAAPDAEEVISYQLPAFRQHGWLCYLSVATKHYAISFPPPFTVFETFAEELKPYSRSKSALRFPKSEPLPLDLVARMVRFRAEENAARARD